MEKLQIINLSNYIRPEIREVSGKKWVLNGDKNSFYQVIIDAYNGSPTNSAIIDSYSQFIYGKGLTSDDKAKKPSEWAAIISLLSKKDLRKICKDFEMFGEASIEVKYINNKIQRCFHIAKQRIAPEVANEEGDITGYYYSYDFANVNKYKPERFDAFGFGDGLGERSEIYIFRDYQVGQFYYSNPSYVSGISWARMEEEISNYSINHIQKGLSFGHIINMNCGIQESAETIQENTRQIRNHLTGSQNAGAFFLNWNDNKDSEITISALEVSDAHQQYAYLSTEARQQLCTAHKLTSPMLVGIKEANGFSSNAEEIKVGFAELMINVIRPKQEIILDGLMEVFAVNGITLDLQFESLRSEEPIIVETPKILETPTVALTQLSSQDFTDLGEDIDLNEWELISSEPVDYENEAELDAEIERLNGVSTQLMKVGLASVSTGVARPNASSYQDGALFKSRYRYSGNPNPEREFCKKMINANKLYRKEDIEMMSQKNVNPGFGMHPNPDQPYDIFLWKGGGLLSDDFPFGTCRHFWVRETYRKRADVNNPNAEIITPAVARKEGEILPTNNPKAYIAPHDM
jgi:capsid portal protein